MSRYHPVDYLEQCLLDWASWMRQSAEVRGYPRSIPGLSTGGASQHFDDLCDAVDRRIAIATDAAIADLVAFEACAIHHAYLGAAWRYPGKHYQMTLEQARENVAAGLRRRHVWLGD